MKHSSKFIVIATAVVIMLMLLVESCAPRIYGARPHRRDRHCGCENQPQDNSCQDNYYIVENQ